MADPENQNPPQDARVTEPTWRDEWTSFRVSLIDETARCLADQYAAATKGRLRPWDALPEVEQQNLLTGVAGVFQAMDCAMAKLTGADGV